MSGEVKINGCIRNQKLFRHQCSYIMQDHTLHSLLTVEEAMKFSINLKIGTEMSQAQKNNRVIYIFLYFYCYLIESEKIINFKKFTF